MGWTLTLDVFKYVIGLEIEPFFKSWTLTLDVFKYSVKSNVSSVWNVEL